MIIPEGDEGQVAPRRRQQEDVGEPIGNREARGLTGTARNEVETKGQVISVRSIHPKAN